jgi:hypothetical protein
MNKISFYKAVEQKLLVRGFNAQNDNKHVRAAQVVVTFARNKATVSCRDLSVTLDFTDDPQNLVSASQLTANVAGYLVLQQIAYDNHEIDTIAFTADDLAGIKDGTIKTWR